MVSEGRAAGFGIDRERVDVNGGLRGTPGLELGSELLSDNGPQAREEFAGREGLGNIVIGARFQACDAIPRSPRPVSIGTATVDCSAR